MTRTPRLTIGLPVRNNGAFLAASLDALLGQTFEDFELVVSDNASTDDTEAICRRYAAADPRIRYFRQDENLGLAGNHNFVVDVARGELFKWAAGDDLYARDLLERCVAALDADPSVVLAHCWTAQIDEEGAVTAPLAYVLDTGSPHGPERFRSVLFDSGGDDIYGVVRTSVLRSTPLMGSHHHSDRTLVAELALRGRFHVVPDWLYFRRDHAGRSTNAPSIHQRAVVHDPRRASTLRHPTVRLVGEYVAAFVTMVHSSALSARDRRACYGHLARWLTSRAGRSPSVELGRHAPLPRSTRSDAPTSIAGRVAGQPAGAVPEVVAAAHAAAVVAAVTTAAAPRLHTV